MIVCKNYNDLGGRIKITNLNASSEYTFNNYSYRIIISTPYYNSYSVFGYAIVFNDGYTHQYLALENLSTVNQSGKVVISQINNNYTKIYNYTQGTIRLKIMQF